MKIGLDLKLDILDTGGSYVFPAMRTLAIKSADGFVLVCAVDDPSSLEVSFSIKCNVAVRCIDIIWFIFFRK